MRIGRGAMAVAVGGLLVTAACDDSLSLGCFESRSPFELVPSEIELAIGEEAAIVRATRSSEDVVCGTLPDSDELVWSLRSLSDTGVVTIVRSDNSGATVRATASGSVRVRAELVALKGIGWNTKVVVVDPE
ncbi:MAG: hypothetical protein ACC682_11000 [Gemmatimonadota bacterium]